MHACNADHGQCAAAQQAATPQMASRQNMQRQASASDEGASQPDMDLQEALKIVSKHYVSRNTTWDPLSVLLGTQSVVSSTQHTWQPRCALLDCILATVCI